MSRSYRDRQTHFRNLSESGYSGLKDLQDLLFIISTVIDSEISFSETHLSYSKLSSHLFRIERWRADKLKRIITIIKIDRDVEICYPENPLILSILIQTIDTTAP